MNSTTVHDKNDKAFLFLEYWKKEEACAIKEVKRNSIYIPDPNREWAQPTNA
jgi:hypothetical protein